MRRTTFASVLVTLLLAVLMLSTTGGCGGGGGTGGSNGSTGTPVTYVGYTLVGVPSGGSTARSLSNVVPGNTLVLRAVGRTSTGTGAFLNVSNVTFDVPTNIATFNADSNSFTVLAGSTDPYTITATVNGNTVTGTLRIGASGAVVTGVSRIDTGTGTPGAIVRFLNGSDAEVATTVVSPNGNFYANVPTSATKFQIDVSGVSSLYYNQFGYGALEYTAAVDGCGPTLPTLNSGLTSALSQNVVLTRRLTGVPPPPPPTGCTLGG